MGGLGRHTADFAPATPYGRVRVLLLVPENRTLLELPSLVAQVARTRSVPKKNECAIVGPQKMHSHKQAS